MTAGLAGKRVGKFDVIEELGQGGMSVVYRARDTQLDRHVAIKVMHGFLAEQPEARERFTREARAVARLRHPNIIEVYDFSDAKDALHFMVAELVDGQSLSAFLGGEPLAPPEAVLVLARPIAAALEHAHAAGIIHRDLKPENILVGRNGTLKLTDFGIARILDGQSMTMTGTLLGSPAYMAPEYIDGKATDARADIFSFGAMLYQLATGKLPFEGPTPHALLKKIAMHDYVAVEQRNPQVSRALARIIGKCMEHDPERRYPRAADLLSDLDTELGRLGLDPSADLPRLLTAPEKYTDELTVRLRRRYRELGWEALRKGQTGQALQDFDRVLGLDPDSADVRRALAGVARRAVAARGLKLAAWGVLGAVLVTLATGVWLSRRADDASGGAGPLAAFAPAGTAQDDAQARVERNVTFVIRGEGDLYVDGKVVGRGVRSTHARLLPAGPHVAELVHASGRRATARFMLAPEGSVAPVELDVRNPDTAPRTAEAVAEPKRKTVAFRTGRDWVNVYVDEETSRPALAEKFGTFELPLTYGRHRLHFSNDYSETVTLDIEVSDRDPPGTVVIPSLPPLPAQLLLQSAPDGALIEVAGKTHLVREATRNEPIRVPMEGQTSRDVEVRISLGGRSYSERITVRAGHSHTLAVRGEAL